MDANGRQKNINAARKLGLPEFPETTPVLEQLEGRDLNELS